MNGLGTGAAQAARATTWTLQGPATAPSEATVAIDRLLASLRECGRRGTAIDRTMPALQRYWLSVPRLSLGERAAAAARLQAEVRAGTTTPRVWLPVALGEPAFELARAATAAYAGASPSSVEHRGHLLEDVLDWVRRGLALNPSAVYAGLLDVAAPGALDRLACLRSRLTPAEAHEVLAAAGLPGDEDTQAFLEDWAASLR